MIDAAFFVTAEVVAHLGGGAHRAAQAACPLGDHLGADPVRVPGRERDGLGVKAVLGTAVPVVLPQVPGSGDVTAEDVVVTE